MCGLASRVASLFALLLLFAVPAAAQGTVPETGAVLVRLVAEARYDEARAVLTAQVAGQPDAALHQAHLEGIIRVREGQLDEAIAIFRAILSAAPDFAPARAELARALHMSGDADAAYQHFEIIAHSTADPLLERMANTAMRAITNDRPYGFSIRGALLPSSNVNRGSSQDVFDAGGMAFSIDETSRATSGIGISVGGSGFATARLDSDHALTASLGLDIRKYAQGADFDQVSLNGSLMLTGQYDGVTVGVGPVATYTWQGWRPNLAQYGVSARAILPMSTQDVVTASFQVLAQDFVTSDHRDGWKTSGALAWKHYFSPARSLTINLGGTIERSQRLYLDHNDISAGLRLDSEWEGGLITSAFGAYERHNYLGDFPLAATPRRDDKITLGATVSHRAITFAGFMPQLTYQYTRQFSNISFFDYDSHDVSLELSKRF